MLNNTSGSKEMVICWRPLSLSIIPEPKVPIEKKEIKVYTQVELARE